MGRLRYMVEDEQVEKWLIEDVVESAARLETDAATRVTITDNATGRKASAVGADYPDALERACSKLGISLDNIEDELDD